MSTEYTKPYSNAIIKLLRGIIDNDDSVWQDILMYQSEIQGYLSVLGLEMIIEKEDGYAFVRQMNNEESALISLVSRRRLTFEVSVVLIVIRQILEEFDSNPLESQSNDKYVSAADIKEEVELFLPEKYNRVKFMRELDKYIERVVELGFLVKTKSGEMEPRYKIHRIIKKKITLDDLVDFKNKWKDYGTDKSI